MSRHPGSPGVRAGRLAAAEEGRRRIARELHDDFSQRLAGLALALKAARQQLPESDPQLPELDAIGGSLAELGEDLRRLSHDLHPAALERRGLAEALRDLCEEIERRHGPRVSLRLTGAEDSFPPDLALGLYRIAQEALANAVRHAGARTVHVTLRAAAGTARLTVADDGGGFDPREARRAGGVGLASIEERAQSLGGRCRITSAPGAGTGIEVTVPLPAKGAPSAGLWAKPDFQSLAFGRKGELLAAKVRLWAMALAALIPLHSVLFRPPEAEARIGLAAAAAVLALGAFVLWLAQKATPPAWLGLFTCLLDVSIVSFVNAGFVLAGNPLAAANSRVVFCCYFVALALACLRQDWRWCLIATLAAIVQYGGIVLWAASRYDLHGPAFALSSYGRFNWDNQVSRLLLLALTGAICIVIVVQSRGYWKAVIQYLDSLPLGVLVTGADGKSQYANRAAQELLGRAVPAGVNLSELNDQAFLAGTGQRYPPERSTTVRALAGEASESDDLEIQRPDARIAVAAWGAPILDARGRVSHAVAVFHDQTRRRRAEEELHRASAALKASEERFRGLLETAPDAIVIADRSGAIVLVNEQTEKLFGYLRAELIGQPVEMLVPEDLREAHVRHRSTFLAERGARAMGSGLDLFARRKDGGIFPVEVSLSPLETEQGTLVSSAIRDVTARRRLEQELRAANAELSRLADFDALTGLANRRHFDRRLVSEWSRAMRLNRHLRFPVALVLLDVDHFKAFNDLYGHLAGDACLRRVAEVLRAATHREGDLAARYGGEEFACLLPGTDQDGAWSVAEAIRLQIEELAIPHGAPGASPTLTISAGVAALAPLPDSAPDQLLEAADLALYSAKAMGRNRTARPPST